MSGTVCIKTVSSDKMQKNKSSEDNVLNCLLLHQNLQTIVFKWLQTTFCLETNVLYCLHQKTQLSQVSDIVCHHILSARQSLSVRPTPTQASPEPGRLFQKAQKKRSRVCGQFLTTDGVHVHPCPTVFRHTKGPRQFQTISRHNEYVCRHLSGRQMDSTFARL